MDTVRFGLIGYGAWGRHHAAAIRATPGSSLTVIAARSEATRADAGNEHPGTAVLADYRDLIGRDDVDVVAVVLPSHLHYEVAAAALDAGKHVLLEKPMCLGIEECDTLIGQAARGKRLLAVGHELRLSSLWGRVKQLVDAGAIGEPLYVLIELWRKPYRLGSDGWRYDIGRVGSWILEEPIHFFDLARWYLAGRGDPESVYARANSRQPEHPELNDNFSAVVNFPQGAYAVISQTLSAFEHHQVAKLTGTAGAIWASWSGAEDRTRKPTFWLKHFDGRRVEDIKPEKTSGEVFELEEQVAMIARAVRDGEPLTCTGKDGRWSVALCLAAQRSVDAGTPVSLDHVDA